MQRVKITSVCFLLFYLFAQTNLCSQQYVSKSDVKKALKEFVNNPLLKSASVSFAIKDLRNGKIITSFDENRALVPASSQKIITSALILNELTDSFKFQTPFFLKGEYLSDGSLYGNLEIIGKGDPSFASEYFTDIPKVQGIADTLISIFKKRGLSKIKGRIIVNEQFITDIPENKEWLWYDLGNYYGAGCFGLNYAENQAIISLAAAKEENGICNIFRVQPSQLMSLYTSKVIGKIEPIEKDVYVLGNSQSCRQEIWGEMKCCNDDTLMIRSALVKPSEVFVYLLKEALAKKGIEIEEMNISPKESGELIYTSSSPALKELVQRALARSVNLYCESFLHQLGYQWNGTSNRQLALLKMNQLLIEVIPNDESIIMEDGSGLSPKNMISSLAFVKFLEWIDKNDSLNYFWQLLPDNSNQGALSKWLRIKEKDAIGLRLKSGTMERVRSYSGYLVHDDKPIYALSLMVNHYTCKGEEMNKLIAQFFNKMLNSN